jgi:hypothetical protein
MAVDQGEKTYLSHTAQEVDDAIDAIATLVTKTEFDAEIDTIKDALAYVIDTGSKNLTAYDTGAGDYVDIPLSDNIPIGKYVVSFAELDSDDTDASTCMVVARFGNTEVSDQVQCQRSSDGTHVTLTLTSTADTIRIYASDTSAHSSGDTLTFVDCMVCKESMYKITDKFVPYCPTLYEVWLILHRQSGTST